MARIDWFCPYDGKVHRIRSSDLDKYATGHLPVEKSTGSEPVPRGAKYFAAIERREKRQQREVRKAAQEEWLAKRPPERVRSDETIKALGRLYHFVAVRVDEATC